MGEVKITKNSSCKIVAVRYRFIFENIGGGEPQLQFLPHPVVVQKVDVPKKEEENKEPKEEELLSENVEYEDDVEYLRSLDPKEWKNQDHYKVLGIGSLRFKATEDIIKTAYRKKVLKHHPDKRKALGEEVKADDDYFTCITMAYETLGNVNRRRAYDSVDPEFDNNLPSSSDLKRDFYEVFSYYFNLNSRWSEKSRVPKIGNSNSSREEVEHFYSFWYDFKSWREYSYEDEEDKDKCQDREERRYVDKLNKAERLRKKKEEMSRIRQLVDLAYNNDPRIAKFKQDDKEKKLAAKRAKQSAAQAKKEEEERLLKEMQLAKEQAEAAEKARIEAKRQEREAQKKAIKKERKTLRDICKSNNYYADSNEQNLAHMTAVEAICERLSLIELEELNRNIKNIGKSAFLKALKENEVREEQERLAVLDAAKQKNNTIENKTAAVVKMTPEWNENNIQLLVKAVNLFPAGTNQRWEVVANFINQHGTFSENNSKFNAKLVLAKAKDLQNTDFSKNNLKEVANKQAFDNFKKDKKNVLNIDETGISKKLDGVSLNGDADIKPTSGVKKTSSNGDIKVPTKTELPWTTSEQQLLEQALKTYPSSTPERWDRIAECIPNRTKKECMKRYKELVETVKAKKAAQAALASK
ncbi:dnaJ homolog subfamily C member 2 [Anoplophora glabripennis]|nr:dnaJ homolog subfamily C member 2 [Anoplophora glabripennis]